MHVPLFAAVLLQVRAGVIELLEAWVSVAPADAPFDEVVDVLPSPKCVSEGMQVRGRSGACRSHKALQRH